MALVVVGGHARNIGKTGVMAGVIAALTEMRWTAIKITQFGHDDCLAKGGPCECATVGDAIVVSEERDAASGKDTARFLAAGAVRSYWVKTPRARFAEAMPQVRQLITNGGHVIVESNSLLQFLQPDLVLFVVDGRVTDFKESALRSLERADALVVVGDATNAEAMWQGIEPSLYADKQHFFVDATAFRSDALQVFVREACSKRV